MRQIYLIMLLSFALVTSCTENEEGIENTVVAEPVDYSSFVAKVDNTTSSKVISRAVSYNDYAKPALTVCFEDGQEATYTYDSNDLCYYVDDEDMMGEQAQYLYSAEYNNNTNGAMVAASWPEEFNNDPSYTISLRNMKPRIRVNYKYLDTESISAVESISIHEIYTSGELTAMPTLIYTATGDKGSVTAASSADDVYASTLTEEEEEAQEEGLVTYITGAYELYTVPQVISTYEAYVKFVIDGAEHLYYFKDKVSLESGYSYELVFEIEMFDDALNIELTDQYEYKDWEDDGDSMAIVIDSAYKFDTWDGSSTSTSFSGSGVLGDPYMIESAADLKYFNTLTSSTTASTYHSAHYELAKNIDWDSQAWQPVGSTNAPFLGVFDGGGFTIKNLVVSYGYNNGGMFGMIGDAATTAVTSYTGELKNLSITAVVVGGGNNIGGFAGTLKPAGNIENCHFSGSVSGTMAVGGIVGSMSGRMAGCTVIGSTITSTTETTGTTLGSGGIIGQSWSNTNNKSYYCLVLNTKVSGPNEEYCGGLVGTPWNQWQACYYSLAYNVTTDNESDMFGLYGYLASLAVSPTTGDYVTYYWLYNNYPYYAGTTSFTYGDDARYLDADSYTLQQMCNLLNDGDVDTEYAPAENPEGWYWAVNNSYDSPFPTYNE